MSARISAFPLQWMSVAAFLIAAGLALAGRWKWVLAPVLLLIIKAIIPPIVSGVYVKPNELTLQRPFINTHIQATRSAYGLDTRLKEVQHPGQFEASIDPVRNKALLDNVRLWDWRAFHDTVTQLQALRQYYVFADTDVDRYTIDGQLRQVMIAPREMDIRQLADAHANWINGHFIYTHGYGLVMAEANRITAEGQPVFLVEDAPPRILTKSMKLTRPEIYYGEVTHEPVFVHTQQAEFNYPSGSRKCAESIRRKGWNTDRWARDASGRRLGLYRPQCPSHRRAHSGKPHDDQPQRSSACREVGGLSSNGTTIPIWL